MISLNHMNKTITISILALVFIGGFFLFYKPKTTPGPTQNNSPVSNAQQWEAKTDEQANVTVVVTPLDPFLRSTLWRFDVGMNTHSVELNQDMTKVAVLVDDQGREYEPLKWEGPIGGHHREGTLTFVQLMPVPKSVELKIYNIGGVTRSFIWQL